MSYDKDTSTTGSGKSAHESLLEMKLMLDTMRTSVEEGSMHISMGVTPEDEQFLMLQWPHCPFLGKVVTHFGPLDLENYSHDTHPLPSMRGVDIPSLYEDVPNPPMLEAALQALGTGKMKCPITGETHVRVYDCLLNVARSTESHFQVLFTTGKTRWAVSFGMGAEMSVSITDVQRLKEN
jgi:hypothetical protein